MNIRKSFGAGHCAAGEEEKFTLSDIVKVCVTARNWKTAMIQFAVFFYEVRFTRRQIGDASLPLIHSDTSRLWIARLALVTIDRCVVHNQPPWTRFNPPRAQ